MSHKDNKNSKSSKKSNQKTKKELQDMKIETSNEIGFSSQTRKLGKDKPKKY